MKIWPVELGGVVSEFPELVVGLLNTGTGDCLTMKICPVELVGVVSEFPELVVGLLNNGAGDCLTMNICPVELVGVVDGVLGNPAFTLLTIRFRKGFPVFTGPPFCTVGF